MSVGILTHSFCKIEVNAQIEPSIPLADSGDAIVIMLLMEKL
jgi:hypothetical protein